ncbi:hypothetical protein Anapl_08523 [Anas platyrhynchos]|uniref:Uncharacterized protein n=1 Tax=Anas platyrhynchos TaxID=8839 RepID=R0KC68_ANAPL|nr:hypothetical protein Anapl_08523 [Anas platyrhynchos]
MGPSERVEDTPGQSEAQLRKQPTFIYIEDIFGKLLSQTYNLIKAETKSKENYNKILATSVYLSQRDNRPDKITEISEKFRVQLLMRASHCTGMNATAMMREENAENVNSRTGLREVCKWGTQYFFLLPDLTRQEGEEATEVIMDICGCKKVRGKCSPILLCNAEDDSVFIYVTYTFNNIFVFDLSCFVQPSLSNIRINIESAVTVLHEFRSHLPAFFKRVSVISAPNSVLTFDWLWYDDDVL